MFTRTADQKQLLHPITKWPDRTIQGKMKSRRYVDESAMRQGLHLTRCSARYRQTSQIGSWKVQQLQHTLRQRATLTDAPPNAKSEWKVKEMRPIFSTSNTVQKETTLLYSPFRAAHPGDQTPKIAMRSYPKCISSFWLHFRPSSR